MKTWKCYARKEPSLGIRWYRVDNKDKAYRIMSESDWRRIQYQLRRIDDVPMHLITHHNSGERK